VPEILFALTVASISKVRPVSLEKRMRIRDPSRVPLTVCVETLRELPLSSCLKAIASELCANIPWTEPASSWSRIKIRSGRPLFRASDIDCRSSIATSAICPFQ
jgi:hypothetical protein